MTSPKPMTIHATAKRRPERAHDEMVVTNARRGDAAAIEELVRRHQKAAFAVAMSFLQNRDDAADAVQDAFIEAIGSLQTLTDLTAFPQWLRAIVHHQCFRLIRRSKRHLSLEHTESLASPLELPDSAVERNDDLERVMNAMHALSADQRELLSLRYLGEMSQREIASLLHLPITTVNTRLHEAKGQLKRILLKSATTAMREHAAVAGIPERVGRLVSVKGPVMEVKCSSGTIPEVLAALSVGGCGGAFDVTALVTQHLGNDVVRCIASVPSPKVDIGAPVGPSERRLIKGSARARARAVRILALTQRSAHSAAMEDVGRRKLHAPLIETGIKVVDVFAPIARGSSIALTGEAKTGKLVLAEEIVSNVAKNHGGLAFFTFVPPAEVESVQRFAPNVRERLDQVPDVEALFVLASDDDDAGQSAELLDTVIGLSAAVGAQGLYPAVDPMRCRSRWLQGVGKRHRSVVTRALEAFAEAPDSARAVRLRAFLSQPFFVAEPFSGREGRFVTRQDALRGCAEILAGKHDQIPVEHFTFAGGIDEVQRRFMAERGVRTGGASR